jgi:hypothetical protein
MVGIIRPKKNLKVIGVKKKTVIGVKRIFITRKIEKDEIIKLKKIKKTKTQEINGSVGMLNMF